MILETQIEENVTELAVDFYGDKDELETELLEIQALRGRTGDSAYEIAVKNGFQGSESDWLKSLVGNSGYSGSIDELQIVNDISTGGATSALSAEMGKQLNLNMHVKSLDFISWDVNQNEKGFLASGGMSVTANTGYTTTPYIDVTSYSEVYVTAKTGQIHGTVFGYDSEMNFVSKLLGAQKTVTDEPIAIPENISYIRVNSSSTPIVKYAYYTNRFDKLQEEIGANKQTNDTFRNELYNSNYNYLDNGTLSNGWLLADGTVNLYSGSYYVSDFVEVVEGETYYVDSVKNAAGVTVGGYNESQGYVLSLLALGDHAKTAITIPTGIRYVRVSSKTSPPMISQMTYVPKVDDVSDRVSKIKTDLYTAYKKILYNEDEIFNGFIAADGLDETKYDGYYATPSIDVSQYEAVYVDTKMTNTGIKTIFTYDSDGNVISKTNHGEYNRHEIVIAGTTIKYIRVNGQGVMPSVYIKTVGTGVSKKKIAKNVNWVGMSIWWYDGRTLADVEGRGGNEIAKGYQTLLKNQYDFLSDKNYCYSGNSLGAASESATTCLMNNASSWTASENAIWTLDTITNDFKLNVPIGTTDDYDNKTGLLTYYGALREFADKVKELSGDDAIVIASNALCRNNSGATSTSKNSKGHTLMDYEKALTYACMVNGWWYVDQYRLCGVNDNTLDFTTIDGLHLNNLGYRMAVVPWSNVFEMIYSQLIG